MYNIYVASFYGAIDTFYVGLCLYSMAYLNDLMDLINEMDMELFRHRKFPILNQSTHDNSLTNRISVMVKYHYKVLEYNKKAEIFENYNDMFPYIGLLRIHHPL